MKKIGKSQNAENRKEGSCEIFQHPFCRKTKKIEGDPLVEKKSKKNAQCRNKTERGPFSLARNVCYPEKKKNFFDSIPWTIGYSLNFVELLVELFWSLQVYGKIFEKHWRKAMTIVGSFQEKHRLKTPNGLSSTFASMKNYGLVGNRRLIFWYFATEYMLIKPKGSPLLHFSALCDIFWKKKIKNFKFFLKCLLRFLSIRYSADFRCSRLVYACKSRGKAVWCFFATIGIFLDFFTEAALKLSRMKRFASIEVLRGSSTVQLSEGFFREKRFEVKLFGNLRFSG